MSGTESPLMQMLGTQMRYLTERQTVLSQNVANIDTPGYRARDLKKLDFADLAAAESSRLQLQSTSPKHIGGDGNNGIFAVEEDRNTFETSPMHNNIGVEEQMAHISQTGAEYQVASAMFRKFTQLYRSALGNR